MTEYQILPERGRFRVMNMDTRALTPGRFHTQAAAELWISAATDKEMRSGRPQGARVTRRDYAGDNERTIRRIGGGL